MPRFKTAHKGLKLLPIDFDKQLLLGTFEHALCYLVAHELDLSDFHGRSVEALLRHLQHRDTGPSWGIAVREGLLSPSQSASRPLPKLVSGQLFISLQRTSAVRYARSHSEKFCEN